MRPYAPRGSAILTWTVHDEEGTTRHLEGKLPDAEGDLQEKVSLQAQRPAQPHELTVQAKNPYNNRAVDLLFRQVYTRWCAGWPKGPLELNRVLSPRLEGWSERAPPL